MITRAQITAAGLRPERAVPVHAVWGHHAPKPVNFAGCADGQPVRPDGRAACWLPGSRRVEHTTVHGEAVTVFPPGWDVSADSPADLMAGLARLGWAKPSPPTADDACRRCGGSGHDSHPSLDCEGCHGSGRRPRGSRG
jgi:hypothetical protein